MFKKKFVESLPDPVDNKDNTASWRQLLVWGGVGLLLGLLIIVGLAYYAGSPPDPPANDTQSAVSATYTSAPIPPTATAAPSATAMTPSPVTAQADEAVAVIFREPTATPTPQPGDTIFTLKPAAGDIGWLTSGDERGNHLGDSFVYSGSFDGEIYVGAFQFDLSAVPRGASISHAFIQMTGLREDRLGRKIDQPGGAWLLRWLDSGIDTSWRRHGFQDVFNTTVQETLSPAVNDQDLALNKTNIFSFSPAQLQSLEQFLVDSQLSTLSFRLDGPLVGGDNLFAWDSGHGPESQGDGVKLVLYVGQPPATPPSYNYVVVTSTPTPQNVVTAAAISAQMTAQAEQQGTPTLVPANLVTATPIPDYLVLVPTPTALNEATVQAMAVVATAEALTTGTPTPLPANAVTATPTVTPTPTQTPSPVIFVLITSTPTPDSVFAAATQSARATTQAAVNGTATPLPGNWATPLVVTATPTPQNGATAQYIAQVATAQAYTTGTPTPFPSNMVTATPTPVFDVLPLILSVTPTATATPAASEMPPALVGKVLFRSDREVGPNPQFLIDGPNAQTPVYVYDPATGTIGRLTDPWPYQAALERNLYSADTNYRTYIKQLLWTNIEDDNGNPDGPVNRIATTEFGVHVYDYTYNVESLVTHMGAGIAYDPAWSPVSNEIVFVSTESGNDEIWVMDHRGDNLRQLTNNKWEWDKFPSWSPNGNQIVFSSNRTDNQQLWLMNADGSDPQLLMGWDNWTPYNDWAPVWVSHSDLPPIR